MVFGCERGFPLGKCVRPADVKANVIKHRLGSRTRGQAVSIAIDAHIRHGSVRRVRGRKTQQVIGKICECFTIGHADANLHDFFYRTHGSFPFAVKHRGGNIRLQSLGFLKSRRRV
jgi:hypothetical protein